MKVYNVPKEVPAPTVDFKNWDMEKHIKDEDNHIRALTQWLRKNGYTGKNTGKVVRFQVADGYAQYMLAEGRKSVLIHLPYGDAWNYQDIGYLPKRAILDRIKQQEGLAKLFAKPTA